jgi:hypothetical protein
MAALSRMERSEATIDRLPKEGPTRESMTEPPGPPPSGPKSEEPKQRETLAPAARPAPADTLPEDVVMRLLDTGRTAYVRCFKKAVESDPTTVRFKVKIHVELDPVGEITVVNADTTDTTLASCLVRATRWLPFPAVGKRIAVDLPLFYQ